MTVAHEIITRDELAAMAASDERYRYELTTEGVLELTPPANIEHARAVTHLLGWLLRHGADPDRLVADAGLATKGQQDGGRMPDLMLLNRVLSGATYIDPAAVALIVEVTSHATRTIDLQAKVHEYAEVGIEHYWVVDLVKASAPLDAVVERYHLRTEHGLTGYHKTGATPLRELLQRRPSEYALPMG